MNCIEHLDAVEAEIQATIATLEGLQGVAYHNGEARHYNRKRALRELRQALDPLAAARRFLAPIPDPVDAPDPDPDPDPGAKKRPKRGGKRDAK